MKTLKIVFEWAAWVMGFILVWLLSVPISGLLISETWSWFVMPITGYRAISISEGFGLAIFFAIAGSIATAHLQKFEIKCNAETPPSHTAARGLAKLAGIAVIAPIIGLASSWLWHTFFVSPPLAY